MVVKLETVAALCADAYPSLGKSRGRDVDCTEFKKQKKRTALPALVEDESEESFVEDQRSFIISTELRRQKSVSPQRRERMRRQLAMPSLSEDEEP